ncbi:hypothetical protein Tco_0727171 [Tanacetum coccineum]|uniref:Uncharacterized protein n=1 Tax=Tanacetum coccineum TaxID=301880 RepID=A0ABQ4YJY3_9ASTR
MNSLRGVVSLNILEFEMKVVSLCIFKFCHSSDDESYENIEYVEASPLNLEYDSLEEENEDQEEKEFDLEDIFQIQDVILREKLLNVHRLITNIESLKNNPTPDFVFKSPSSFPIPVVDSDSFFEESDTSLSHLDNSLPEFETFSDHTEETRSGRLTGVVISDNSNDPLLELPEFESFHFDLDQTFPRPPPEPPDVEISLIIKPDAPVINNVDELNEDEYFDPGGGADIAKVTRKRLKLGKNEHGNGRARKKPGGSYQSQKVKHQSTLGQHGQH